MHMIICIQLSYRDELRYHILTLLINKKVILTFEEAPSREDFISMMTKLANKFDRMR